MSSVGCIVDHAYVRTTQKRVLDSSSMTALHTDSFDIPSKNKRFQKSRYLVSSSSGSSSSRSGEGEVRGGRRAEGSSSSSRSGRVREERGEG